MKSPLEGVRVVDLTHAYAGPLCTYTLSRISVLGSPIALARTPGRARVPALGEDTDGVLRELGYGEDDIALLRERRLVRTRAATK